MKQVYMVVDLITCHGCNNCYMGCKDEHVGNDWPGYTAAQPRHGHYWIDTIQHERGQYSRNDVCYLPKLCQHCENAPCIKAGNGAVVRREDGIVMIDMQKAKGNEALVKSCPYGAIFWNEEAKVAQKCTMCAHLLDDDTWAPKKPRCVHNCPTGSLQFFKLDAEELEKMVKSEGLEVYKPELNTKPHVYYKNLYRYTKNFIAGGVLVDGDCFENAVATLKSKVGGVVCVPAGAGVSQCTDTSALATAKTNFFGDFKFDALVNGEYIIDVEAAGRKTSIEVEISGESKNLGFIKL